MPRPMFYEYRPKGPIRALRGTTLNCKNWDTEAAMRMLMNNLDPQVALTPEELVVYGGSIQTEAKADILLMELDNFEQIPYYGNINLIKFVIKSGKVIVVNKKLA